MKRLAFLALAGAIACAGLVSAVPGRASSLYPVVITMKGEGATISVSSPTNTYVLTTVYVQANSTRSLAVESSTVYYDFSMKACGKTHTSRWNRVGAGVNVTASACNGFSFSQR